MEDETSPHWERGPDGSISVRLGPDLVALVSKAARTSGSTFDEVIVKALKNERLIVDQLAQGRIFQVKDRKKGVAQVDFI